MQAIKTAVSHQQHKSYTHHARRLVDRLHHRELDPTTDVDVNAVMAMITARLVLDTTNVVNDCTIQTN